MFNRGITQLMERLPEFEGLDGDGVKRLLTSAYLEGLDLATLVVDDRQRPLATELRRLVSALEVHAILVPGVEEQTRRACAFVAAECLDLLSNLGGPTADTGSDVQFFAAFGSRERYRRIETALLYRIAAFDANAAIVARQVIVLPASDGFETEQEGVACEWTLRQIIALLRLSPAPSAEAKPPAGPDIDAPEHLVSDIRTALWHRIGEICRDHLSWLRLEDNAPDTSPVDQLGSLGQLLEDPSGAAYADIAHLARLLRFACEGTTDRALRRVPPPEDPSVFLAYQQRRCRQKPLLWPSAEHYRRVCLPGPSSHAAVSMPTGSGKSGVAELAVAQALARGWVLYLAPTRALVRQVRRDLQAALGSDIEVREFLGGAEFTALADDSLTGDSGRSVLVMTPEKCSLALRQSPEAFADLALCVFDECHLIGEPGNRGVLAELVLAQILQLAPAVTVLMQSALLANPEEIAAWLRQATGRPCEPIHEPWRPTRTLRAVAGFDGPGLVHAQELASRELAALPRRVHFPFNAPLNLLVSLQGAWAQDDPRDYALARTPLTAPLTVSRTDDGFDVSSDGYVNNATGAVAQSLADAGHRVLAFIPANKHYSFSVAAKLRGFSPNGGDGDDQVEHLLDLADFELGTRSLLRDLLAKGIAVHTSAMLPEERRASERAYEHGIARVVFATGTLAQGLNLPATAVVIGGVNIGYDPNLSAAQREARQQAQLLNAVGRAGRPYVAARSLAIVLPNQAWMLGPEDPVQVIRAKAAPFLAEEDASFALRSQLEPLVADALRGGLTVDDIGVEGLTAFAFLPLRSDVEEAVGVLGRTYAVARRPDIADEQVRTVAASMVRLGEQVLHEHQAPDWLIEAAYESGLSLRQIVALWAQVRRVDQREFPNTITGWAEVLVNVLRRVPYPIVAEMLRLQELDGTLMRDLADANATARHPAAWSVFNKVVEQWLDGLSLTELAAVAVRRNAAFKSGRGSGNPLPKIIGLTEQILVFGMTRIAGGLDVLVTSAIAREADLGWQLSPYATRALEQLSMGLRAGTGDAASLLWWRFGGLRHRRLAHLAARVLPPPEDVLLTDESARQWARDARKVLLDLKFLLDTERVALSDDERKAMLAMALLSDT